MRRLLTILALLTILSGLFLPIGSVKASGSPPTPPIKTEQLSSGWHRLNPYATYRTIGTVNGMTTNQMTVTSAPTTLDDNKTLIDPTWYSVVDDSGQQYFESGVNRFTALVRDGRVSVQDANGKLYIWDSSIAIGTNTYEDKTATITNDPLNPNYHNNTLVWHYGQVTRYVRDTEGMLSEMWIVSKDPKSSISINLSNKVETNAEGDVVWLYAYDANYNTIPVSKNQYGIYQIAASDLANATYPVTIDPTVSMTSNTYDGMLQNISSAYATALNAATATSLPYDTPSITVGQVNYGSSYLISKGTLYFDTSSLNPAATITAASVALYGSFDYTTTDFNITMQSGQPTYPHMPQVAGDYYHNNYGVGSGGQLYSSGWSLTGYNVVSLNAQGISWINKTGYTKLYVNSDRVMAGTAPAGSEDLGFWAADYGQGYGPQLSITYSVTTPVVATGIATATTETTITANGSITNDGGELDSVRFQYDLSNAYNYATAWVAGYSSGQNFSATIMGLAPGTLYYYRAQATNSGGTGSGSDAQVLTCPWPPNTFSATGGNATVALAWTKGGGAGTTVIQRATDTYPSTPTSGTNVYNGAGTSTNDNTVVNGTTYYYSAWSYTTSGGLTQYSQTYATSTAAPSAPTVCTVTTNAPTGVTTVAATLNGNLDSLGGYASCTTWFQYYSGGGTWTDHETTPAAMTSPGPFSAGIAGLTPGTLYHMRTASHNTAGNAYGADVTFTTGAASAPTMTTGAATGVQLSSATLNGTVTDSSGLSVTVWFQYGLTNTYGSVTPTSSGLITADTFYYGLNGLTANTTYHFRAVGQNSVGIAYGSDLTFLTSTPSAPTVRSDAATGIGAHSAQLNGTLLTDGGVSCDVRFQWSPTGAYGGEETSTSWVSGESANQSFNYNLTGLAITTLYHFRAQARNAGGTASGTDTTFTTVFTAPTNFLAKPISSTTINLSWTKTGDQTFIVYKAGSTPIDRADGTQAYFGPNSAAAVSGLQAGTTYYFAAWSWATGDIWASGSVSDAATTLPGSRAVTTPTPGTGDEPIVPASWWQEPDSSYLAMLPFYSAFNSLADAYQVPHGSAWFILGMILTILGGAIAIAIPPHSGMAAAIVGLFIMFIVGMLHMLSMWLLLPYAIIMGGILYGIRRQ